MPKGSPELTAARKEEIINACELLYQTMSFKDLYLEEPYVPHPLAGVMVQNKRSDAEMKHVWSVGDQLIGH